MSKSMIVLALVLTLMGGACAGDVTASDEYQTLELEAVDLEQQLSDTQAELSEARAMLDQPSDEAAGCTEVPAEIVVLFDEWWAANERGDGSVTDLYTATGYHLYGDEKILHDDLAAHLANALNPEWITEPYLIVAEPDGRYVVTRGIRVAGMASAFTMEIVTKADGDLKIEQTAWTYAH
jgi:hypothetical protein